MHELIAELALELVTIVAYTLLAVLLSVLGLLAEQAGIATFGTGELGMAAWFVFVGLILLVGAVLVVRDRLLPRLQDGWTTVSSGQ